VATFKTAPYKQGCSVGYVVKEADIRRDKEILLNIIRANRTRQEFPYEKRYNWLYFENPYGPATAWIIWDENKEYPAGFTAAYPRKMLVKGSECSCWNCGDFSIEKKYRALGVAVQLRKEAKRHVDEGKVPFLYAHPNNQMVHIHLRVQHKKIGHMKRFVLPLRVSNYLEGNKFGKMAGRVLDPVVSGLVKFKFRKPGDYENLPMEKMRFDESYRMLCEEINRSYPVTGLRDESYLSWKYKNHPVLSYHLFNYYEKEKLSGYIFYLENQNVLYITEFVCKPERRAQQNLLSTFMNFCIHHKTNIYSISTVTLEYNSYVTVLRNNGFKFRDDATSSVIAYSADPELKAAVEDGTKWFMNVGDRDS
jgi:hypothetical protein